MQQKGRDSSLCSRGLRKALLAFKVNFLLVKVGGLMALEPDAQMSPRIGTGRVRTVQALFLLLSSVLLPCLHPDSTMMGMV